MDELLCTAAAFFRNAGKNTVTENEFVMDISMRFKWMVPSDAKVLLDVLTASGYVEKDGGFVRPKFDVHGTDVPLGFRPPADMLKGKGPKKHEDMKAGAGTPKKESSPATVRKDAPAGTAKKESAADDLLSKLLAAAESSGMKRKDAIISANALQKRMNVDIEIAAMLMLAENGINISEYCGAAYETIAKR